MKYSLRFNAFTQNNRPTSGCRVNTSSWKSKGSSLTRLRRFAKVRVRMESRSLNVGSSIHSLRKRSRSSFSSSLTSLQNLRTNEQKEIKGLLEKSKEASLLVVTMACHEKNTRKEQNLRFLNCFLTSTENLQISLI